MSQGVTVSTLFSRFMISKHKHTPGEKSVFTFSVVGFLTDEADYEKAKQTPQQDRRVWKWHNEWVGQII